MKNLSVLDADSLVYGIVWKYADASTGEVFGAVSDWVHRILRETQADLYLGFLGGVGNFRKEVATSRPYKGSRKEDLASVAHWKPLIRQHLVKEWGFVQCHGIEADDACSIAHQTYSPDHRLTICSVDHDLQQIPGHHYHYTKGTTTFLTTFQASYNFWHQMGTGCSGDEVPGINKWGIVKMTKLLADCEEEWQLGNAVLGKYLELHSQDYYQEQYTLLKLLTTEEYGFQCPQPIPVPNTLPQPVEVDIAHLFV